METLLRELEKQLAGMTAAQRATTTASLAALIKAAGGMKDLRLSRPTVMRGLQVMMFGLAQGKAMSDHLAAARALAPKVGPYVQTLVFAIT